MNKYVRVKEGGGGEGRREKGESGRHEEQLKRESGNNMSRSQVQCAVRSVR